jgi:hypothetical protein
MGGNVSLYEKRLLSKIEAGDAVIDPWALRLKLACYNARRGDLAGAKKIISSARKVFGLGSSAAAMVHINLAEAVCEFFEHGINASILKLARARALSTACVASDDAPAMIAIWFAALHRYRAEWGSMGMEIRNAVIDPSRISGDVRCRLGLVLGDAYLEAGCGDLSDKWYKFARRWANELGDDATVGASIHNRSAFRIFNTRLELVGDRSGQVDSRLLRVEAESVSNFGTFYTDQAFAWTLGLLQGQVSVLERRYEDALRLLGPAGEEDGGVKEWPAADLVRAADILLCNCLLGNLQADQVELHSDRLRRSQFEMVGPGDRAIAADTLARALEHTGNDASVAYARIAVDSLYEYRNCQDREKAVLVDLADFIDSSESPVRAV